MDKISEKIIYRIVIMIIGSFLIIEAIYLFSGDKYSILYAPAVRIAKYLFFIMFFTSWGAFTNYRCANRNIKILLNLMNVCIVAEVMLDFIKDIIVFDIGLTKAFWYIGLLPEYLIPFFFYMTALAHGETAMTKKLRIKIIVSMSMTAICILAIITNELHHGIFHLNYKEGFWDLTYSYEPAYFILYIWAVLCYAMAIIILVTKARNTETKKYFWLPITMGIVLFCYTFAFVAGLVGPEYVKATGDPGIYIYLIVVAIFEGLLRKRFLPVNSGYGEFFLGSTVGMAIEDESGRVKYKTKNYGKKDVLSIVHQINGGQVTFEEDIRTLNLLQYSLAKKNKELTAQKAALDAKASLEGELMAVEYRNRLYNEVEDTLANKFSMVRVLIDLVNKELKGNDNPRSVNQLLKKISVLITYIKRKCNFILLAKENKKISTVEVELAIRESLTSIETLGINCAIMNGTVGEKLSTIVAMLFLDWYEEIVETFAYAEVDSFAVTFLKDADGYVKLTAFLDAAGSDKSGKNPIQMKFSHALVSGAKDYGGIIKGHYEGNSYIYSIAMRDNMEGNDVL